MSGIYQEIWNADQAANGIEAVLDTENGSFEQGYVRVNANLETHSDPALKVLTKVHIPDHKMHTYEACRSLFNNYTLAEPMEEFDTARERQEMHNFITAIIETEPMNVAKAYIERESGSTVTRERWYNTIVELWFRRFSMGGDPALSGFEHVVVGEQEKSKVQGYHFWWKYFLDDGFADRVDDGLSVPNSLSNDRIIYHGSKLKQGQKAFPESVTISYRWHAPDYENMAVRSLFKRIGGFFVGCSVEGLMALGTVRAHKGIRAPSIAVIEGARYDMKLFHSPNRQHIRTFYPMFLGPADVIGPGSHNPTVAPVPGNNSPTGSSDVNIPEPVRIIGAKVNPKGHDPGFETIMIANVSAEDQILNDWCLKDKNNNSHVFQDKTIKSGEFLPISLSGENVQLSNKGGHILLYNSSEQIVQKVSYSKAQARAQGVTILF